jgi:hypothetical protein
MTKNDHQILEELYVNSKIKQAIKKLVKEGKSKDEIEQILSEAGFLNRIGQGIGNVVQGAKNLKQNYWDDPRAIKAGQKAGYGMQGQAARAKGQTAYNRQTTRKFQNQIAKTMKGLDKTVDKSVQAINKTIFQTVDKLFAMIKQEGPNLDGNFLSQQFQVVYNSLNAAMARSTGAIQQNYNNLLNQLQAMGNSLMGGMAGNPRNNVSGNAGNLYGGGGTGALSSPGQGTKSGGSGAAGIVMFEW